MSEFLVRVQWKDDPLGRWTLYAMRDDGDTYMLDYEIVSSPWSEWDVAKGKMNKLMLSRDLLAGRADFA